MSIPARGHDDTDESYARRVQAATMDALRRDQWDTTQQMVREQLQEALEQQAQQQAAQASERRYTSDRAAAVKSAGFTGMQARIAEAFVDQTARQLAERGITAQWNEDQWAEGLRRIAAYAKQTMAPAAPVGVPGAPLSVVAGGKAPLVTGGPPVGGAGGSSAATPAAAAPTGSTAKGRRSYDDVMKDVFAVANRGKG